MQPATDVVYHLVPRNLTGSILYPLNRLRDIAPEVAAEHATKYVGREPLLERHVPQLDCLWNDVLHFSPIDFRRIKRIFVEEGFELGTWRWFEVPVDRLDPERTVITSRTHLGAPLRSRGDFELAADAFETLTTETLEAARQSPLRLREHIRQARAEGRRPLIMAGCPHVLFAGSLDLKDIPIVKG